MGLAALLWIHANLNCFGRGQTGTAQQVRSTVCESPYSLYLSLFTCSKAQKYCFFEHTGMSEDLHRTAQRHVQVSQMMSWILTCSSKLPNMFNFSLPICSALHFIWHFRSYQLFCSNFILGFFFLNPQRREKGSISSANTDFDSGFLPGLYHKIPFICIL